MYKIEYTDGFKKKFKKLDQSIQRLILKWLRSNLYGYSNPRVHGKALTADLSGYWRYRIANYRIIAEIKDEQLIIVAVSVSHRRDIYK